METDRTRWLEYINVILLWAILLTIGVIRIIDLQIRDERWAEVQEFIDKHHEFGDCHEPSTD